MERQGHHLQHLLGRNVQEENTFIRQAFDDFFEWLGEGELAEVYLDGHFPKACDAEENVIFRVSYDLPNSVGQFGTAFKKPNQGVSVEQVRHGVTYNL